MRLKAGRERERENEVQKKGTYLRRVYTPLLDTNTDIHLNVTDLRMLLMVISLRCWLSLRNEHSQ